MVTTTFTLALLLTTRGLRPEAGSAPATVDLSRAWVPPLAAALLLGIGSAAVWTYGRSVLEDGGLTSTQAVWAWIALGLGATVAAVAAPRVLRPGVPTAWAAFVLLTAVATALLALPPLGPLPWLAAALFGLGHTAATTMLIAWSAVVTTTPGPATAAFSVSLLAGQAVGAPLAGALLPHGALAAFWLAAVTTALAAALPAWSAGGDHRTGGRRPRAPARDRGPRHRDVVLGGALAGRGARGRRARRSG